MKQRFVIHREIDLETTYPERVISILGIGDNDIPTLLLSLKKGAQEIAECVKKFPMDLDAYREISLSFAPVAYLLFDRLHALGKQPRLFTHLAVNRHESTKRGPNSIIFWADGDAITGLYQTLTMDGHYGSA